MQNLILTFVLFVSVTITVSSAQNTTVTDTDTSIKYSGGVNDASICKYDASGLIQGQAGCYNVPSNCAAMGQSQSGSASLTFKGSAIYIHSLLFDLSPIYTVTLDGSSTDVDGVRSSGPFICDTLFSKTGLDPNVDHNIALTIKSVSPNRNQSIAGSDDTFIFSLINFIYTVGASNSTSSSPSGTGTTRAGTAATSTASSSNSYTVDVPRLLGELMLGAALVCGWQTVCI